MIHVVEAEPAVLPLGPAVSAEAAATAVTSATAALQGALDQGLDWLVGPDWRPYPEVCPWTVAT